MPPEGVTVREIVFPAAVDLKQAGVDQPLAVFERVFAIGVQFDVARLPCRAARSSCRHVCAIRPATTPPASRRRMRPPSGRCASFPERAVGPPQRADVFDRIAFGTRRAARSRPRRVIAVDPGEPRRPRNRRRALPALEAALDEFDVLSGPEFGGYLGQDDFLKFVRNAENGVRERGLFEGRGPLAILLLVLRRRPRAEPDAVRAADDSDQPGHHRRRLAGPGRAAGASCSAGVRRGDGVRLRRARPRRHPDRGHVRNDQLVAVVQSGDRAAVRRAGARDVRPDDDRLLALFERA